VSINDSKPTYFVICPVHVHTEHQNMMITNYTYASFYVDDLCVSMIIVVLRLSAVIISPGVDISPRCMNIVNSLHIPVGRCVDMGFRSRVCVTGCQVIVGGVLYQ
jgi:hypothetical protein